MAPGEPLLAVRDLSVRFGPVRALEGVNLSVAAGESVALAGENGAGKSTLVRCIAGDLAPTYGQVLLGGEVLPPGTALAGRRGVAVVWQDLALCDNLDVASNLLLGKERRFFVSDTKLHAAATALLAELDIKLPDPAQAVKSLSGGQRQLLAVARALRDRPRLLVLDEPTASLGIEAAGQVEELARRLRRQGTTLLLVSHDIDQLFRVADRVVVLRRGRVAADVSTAEAHPDEVISWMSGQETATSPRRQLSRLHGLVNRLGSADPSSSLSLILSALGAALGTERMAAHLCHGSVLRLAASLGLGPREKEALEELPLGAGGGAPGLAALRREPTVESAGWRGKAPWPRGARGAWAVPIGRGEGLLGTISVFRPDPRPPTRDELDLLTLYAAHAAAAVERERLLAELTARNRVLEAIRDVLVALAGPAPPAEAMASAARALLAGLQAEEVALLGIDESGSPVVRAAARRAGPRQRDRTRMAPTGSRGQLDSLLALAREVLGTGRAGNERSGTGHLLLRGGTSAGKVRLLRGAGVMAVRFESPTGPAALVVLWEAAEPPPGAEPLLADAAHSFHLALEREESERARQEAAAMRRSAELQRSFLSRLSHELRTPLTAVKGYASSLLQQDVTWDRESEERFLSRIAAESTRLGRLVDDLLDFSAIESDALRLQPDWCELGLVLDAARACLPAESQGRVHLECSGDLPAIYGDHERLEQVFVNLLDNAVRHNPPGTSVWVRAERECEDWVCVAVADDGSGLPAELAAAPLGGPAWQASRRRLPTSGAGLGLSIARGIAQAHGGRIELRHQPVGTCLVVHLPVDTLPHEETDSDSEAPMRPSVPPPAGSPTPASSPTPAGPSAPTKGARPGGRPLEAGARGV